MKYEYSYLRQLCTDRVDTKKNVYGDVSNLTEHLIHVVYIFERAIAGDRWMSLLSEMSGRFSNLMIY